MSFGDKIKFVREQLLLTQAEMANELGVTPLTLIRWEQGKTKPHIKNQRAFRNLCQKNRISFPAE